MKTQRMIKNILISENPDFIAITGDTVSANFQGKADDNWWPTCYEKLTSILELFPAVKWGLIAGNTDLEGAYTQAQIEWTDMMYPQSMTT